MTKGFSANANTTLDKRAFQKRRLIFIYFLSGGAFALFGVVCFNRYMEQTKETGSPQLSFTDAHIDLSHEFHWAGDRLIGVTQIKNTSDMDVYIHQIRKSCSCVSLSIDDAPLQAGSRIPANSQLSLKVEMVTQLAGRFSQSVQIEYGKTGSQHATLSVTARLSQPLKSLPERISFNVDEKWPANTEFLYAHASLVDSSDLKAPEFDDLVASDPRIIVDLDGREAHPKSNLSDGLTYRSLIRIKVNPADWTQTTEGWVRVSARRATPLGEHQETVTLPVMVWCKPAVKAFPARLAIIDAMKGTSITRTVLFMGNFRQIKVPPKLPGLEIEALCQKTAMGTECFFEFDSGGRDFDGMLQLQVDGANFEIPLTIRYPAL